jgi:NADH-quinone oxidoreductase subunit E
MESSARAHESGAEGRPEQATPGYDEARPFPAGWDEPADLEKEAASIPQLADVDVPDELRARIEHYMGLYPDFHSATIPALHAAQKVHGWCSPEALRQVAAVMRTTPAYLSSVTTFYDMFKTEPLGRHDVYICTGVACNLCRARELYEAMAAAGEAAEDVHVREFECLGACDMAPMASVDGRYVGPLRPEDCPEVIAAVVEGREVLPGRGLEGMPESAPGRWEANPGG